MLSDALAPSHAEHDASAEDSALDELDALDTDERAHSWKLMAVARDCRWPARPDRKH